MKISEYIALRIDRFPKGMVFTANDFTGEVTAKQAGETFAQIQ